MKLFEDTNPEAEKFYIHLMSQAPIWKKVQIIDQLYLLAVSMARAGIYRRNPNATPEEVNKELAAIFLKY